MGGRELFDFLLNMEGVGEGGLIAIGEGILTVSLVKNLNLPIHLPLSPG